MRPPPSSVPAPRTQSVASRVTQSLLAHVAEIVYETNASALFVYVDAVGGEPLDLPDEVAKKTWYVTKTVDEDRVQEARAMRHLRVPNVSLTRAGQIKMALLLAHARSLIQHGDVVVFLTGVAASGSLDSILVTEIGREYEMIQTPDEDDALPPVRPEVVERVVEIAAALGSEGREGRPVGALFVVGDTERVLSLSRQLILNPFAGYTEAERNVLDPVLEETVKELATVDGAFVIRRDGVIVSAGTYLKTVASPDEQELPPGLGARHHAAAGITEVSRAIAVVVSQSTGTVTVFRDGGVVTSIEQPPSGSRARDA